MKKYQLHKQLYVQVLVSIVIGILLGHYYPHIGVQMKPLGDGFIKLIRMLVAPIIFTTVITGIVGMKDIREVGRIGIKALIYFEVVSTCALIIGLIVANVFQPGVGLNINVHSLGRTSAVQYGPSSTSLTAVDFLLNIIPDTLVSAFVKGDLLPILLISILFGFALLFGGVRVRLLVTLLNQFSTVLFTVVGFIMKIAPIGAFGAMAYTVGAFGLPILFAQYKLLVSVYFTCIVFIIFVLGFITTLCRFNLWRFLKYIKDELFIVLGTSSSEVVLPRMIAKLEQLGCGKTVVGLVLPAGYSFNLDGTAIYLSIATLFIAQALNIDLSVNQQLSLMAVLLVTSKGAAAVTGGGFIVLAATLASTHTIPAEGIMIILGLDRFLSEVRALTNLIGNGVAAVVIAKWEKDFDAERAKSILV